MLLSWQEPANETRHLPRKAVSLAVGGKLQLSCWWPPPSSSAGSTPRGCWGWPGRHLADHGVKSQVYMPEAADYPRALAAELRCL